jgi:hypothetical protein
MEHMEHNSTQNKTLESHTPQTRPGLCEISLPASWFSQVLDAALENPQYAISGTTRVLAQQFTQSPAPTVQVAWPTSETIRRGRPPSSGTFANAEEFLNTVRPIVQHLREARIYPSQAQIAQQFPFEITPRQLRRWTTQLGLTWNAITRI